MTGKTGKTTSLPVSLPFFLTGILTGLLTGVPYRSDPAHSPNPYRFLTVLYLGRLPDRRVEPLLLSLACPRTAAQRLAASVSNESDSGRRSGARGARARARAPGALSTIILHSNGSGAETTSVPPGLGIEILIHYRSSPRP